MLKLEQTNQKTDRQGKNNMPPTIVVGDIKIMLKVYYFSACQVYLHDH